MPATSADRVVNDDSNAIAPAIDVRDVSFRYPKRRSRKKPVAAAPQLHHALDHVTLRLAQGETVALLGPNGSGKSTLLKIIATLLTPDSGIVQIHGDGDPKNARRKLGIVFQRPGLDALMTVRENLLDSARLYGIARDTLDNVLNRALNQAELIDRQHDRVKTLSGGLARRADLCRALLHDPPVVLLDEPTVGLDPAARQSFLQRIDQRRAQSNLTVLMTTHLTDEADRFDRVIFMHHGRIVADDTPANLRRAVGDVRLIVGDPAWSPTPDVMNNNLPWRRFPGGWRLTPGEGRADVGAVAARLVQNNISFTAGPPTLADAFHQWTGATLETPVESES